MQIKTAVVGVNKSRFISALLKNRFISALLKNMAILDINFLNILLKCCRIAIAVKRILEFFCFDLSICICYLNNVYVHILDLLGGAHRCKETAKQWYVFERYYDCCVWLYWVHTTDKHIGIHPDGIHHKNCTVSRMCRSVYYCLYSNHWYVHSTQHTHAGM